MYVCIGDNKDLMSYKSLVPSESESTHRGGSGRGMGGGGGGMGGGGDAVERTRQQQHQLINDGCADRDLSSKKMSINDFHFIKVLGKGSFGKVCQDYIAPVLVF